jgi:HEAT repeat protein
MMKKFLVPFVLVLFAPPGGATEPAQAHTQPEVDQLIRQLGSESFEERDRASKQLVEVGDAARESLQKALKNPDLEVKRRAGKCLREIERNLEIARLLKELEHPDSAYRYQAILGLERLEAPAAVLVPALIKRLDDRVAGIRICAACALGDIGLPARAAAPRMLAIVRDPREPDDLRLRVAGALPEISQFEEEAILILLQFMESNRWQLRHGAARLLGTVGGKQPAVVPALIKSLKDPNNRVQASAAVGLGSLGKDPDLCVPALRELLASIKDLDAENKPTGAVLWALGKFGAHSESAVPLLCEIAQRGQLLDSSSRGAIRALGEIGPAAQGAVPILSKRLSNAAFRPYVAEALFRITGIPVIAP